MGYCSPGPVRIFASPEANETKRGKGKPEAPGNLSPASIICAHPWLMGTVVANIKKQEKKNLRITVLVPFWQHIWTGRI
ncbi:hypothetical protein JCM17844_10460 [Iodidimonas gelatinilytica]|uniref:Uncharacterized protein n=1 Tax=Iodidimonas gelatinilytica TaxID=1236966 RepID=A0A5A7MRA7_9PROT|nr:hypothetical protein JCM17844_10460 [Iodidimonas gelatinilytica]GER02149.1 hypothetical protein JCM17845_27720 [Iodidimonas gelatinilytica]